MLYIVHMKDSKLTKGHDYCSIKMTSPKKKNARLNYENCWRLRFEVVGRSKVVICILCFKGCPCHVSWGDGLSCRWIRELRGAGNRHDYKYLTNLRKCMYLNQSYHQICWTKYSATDARSWSCRCSVQRMEFQEKEEGKKGGQCSESSEVNNLRIEKRRGCWAISSMWKPWAKGWLVGR